ncbi:hypothetical protein VCRA2120O6_10354 [Vibrio crassostreae]|nr:hypothetical protein VCRA2120O6_10354 [Vibrio crassostreae]
MQFGSLQLVLPILEFTVIAISLVRGVAFLYSPQYLSLPFLQPS